MSGAGSFDLEGHIATFKWEQVFGTSTATIISGNTMFPTVSGPARGVYRFVMVVTDDPGFSSADFVTVYGNTIQQRNCCSQSVAGGNT
ncbi:hypothetical protein KTO63_17860 [Parasegetibacter sp. MAH-26]|uniref:PKD/Chitinase domain-containing protein n=1 Tax=Pinibacter aurantiacus TaxID=2851599 RepID=A0A9E2SDB6_9BACT|nr:hypothetical protein [Pinibacter aurantiacus]MBV4359039.1 hypothetical protein [Pinibacter aurantiacus]